MGLLDTSIEDNLTNATQSGLLGLGVDEEMAQKIAPWLAIAPQFLPFVGAGVGVDNTVRALDKGNYGEAAFEGAMTLLGEIPVVGDVAGKAIRGGADRLGIFAGRNSETANQAAADAAVDTFENQTLVKEHAPKAAVDQQRAASGEAGKQEWFVGADGFERYEIPDDKARLTPMMSRAFFKDVSGQLKQSEYAFPEANVTGGLEAVLDHPKLFEAYPELRKLPVKLTNDDAYYGAYNPTDFLDPDNEAYLTLSANQFAKNQRQAKSTLMHELQHAVQDIEGFSGGENLDEALSAAEKWMEEAAPAVEGGFASPSMRKKYENMQGLLETDDKWKSYRAYQRNAGETEARAVEKRLNLNQKQRRERSPLEDYTERRMMPDTKRWEEFDLPMSLLLP
jgi:hypothetical protein